MAGPPNGPTSPVFYSAVYSKLQAIVQAFVRYYFTPAVYKGAIFSGVLTATVFAGMYVAPHGGGTYYFNFGVPMPEAGSGIVFLIALMIGCVMYKLFLSRQAARSNV